MGVHETSVKEHLTNFTMVRHSNKHKMQMRKTKRNKVTTWLLSTAQELMCESRGGRPGLPVLNSPYGLCGRKVTLNWTERERTCGQLELRNCVEVEVAVLDSPVPNKLYGFCGRKAALNWTGCLVNAVSRFGLAVRRYRQVSRRTSVRFRFLLSSIFKSCGLWTAS